MDCEKVQILLAPYALGDLDNDPKRCSQLQAHLLLCPECTEMYEGFQETIGFVLDHKVEFAQAFKKARAMEEENATLEVSFEKPSNKSSLFVKVSAIAACLAIGFMLFFAANQFKKPQNDSSLIAFNQQQNAVKIEIISEGRTKIIPAGQLITTANELKTLRISSNRQMVLNVGTELSVEPYHLGYIVKLDQGEIYTEVEHDGKPFIVETSHGRAIITGTTFNIKADNNKMDLAVIEGSVRFESDKGVVNVKGGYQSSIIAGMKPAEPTVCNIIQIAKWAKKESVVESVQANIPTNTGISELLELSLVSVPYRDLEDINFDQWIDQRREWFEREFPWTKRLQKLLAQDDIEVDTIDLLIESGDLWRFAWPEYSQHKILAEDKQVIQEVASQYGVEIDKLISADVIQYKQTPNIEAFEKWLNIFDKEQSNSTLDSIHAAVFLINTRSLAWYAVDDGRLQVDNKQQVLDLLSEQVQIASNMLEILNQLLLADKGKSICSTAQYDEYIRNLKDNISSVIEIEKELAGYEIISE